MKRNTDFKSYREIDKYLLSSFEDLYLRILWRISLLRQLDTQMS